MKPRSRSSRIGSSTVRRRASLQRCRSIVGGALTALLPAVAAVAQDGGGGTVVVQQQPMPYVGILVVLALCGAALFAVCRSSRRN